MVGKYKLVEAGKMKISGYYFLFSLKWGWDNTQRNWPSVGEMLDCLDLNLLLFLFFYKTMRKLWSSVGDGRGTTVLYTLLYPISQMWSLGNILVSRDFWILWVFSVWARENKSRIIIRIISFRNRFAKILTRDHIWDINEWNS